MDELKAEIRDPGTGETHPKKEESSHHEEVLPPVIGVGWEDEDVVILSAEDLKAQRAKAKGKKKGPKLPTPVTAVTMMDGWEGIVGWKEVIASYEHILAAAEAQEESAAEEQPTSVNSVKAQAKPAPKAQEVAPEPPPSASAQAQPKAAAVASSAWKPTPAAASPAASPWKPAKAAAPAASSWKPSPSAKASPWKPAAPDTPGKAPAPKASAEPVAQAPKAPAPATPEAPQSAKAPQGDNLPPDTLKKVAVLMRKGDIAKSKRVLELWLKTRPTDIVGLKMLAICEEALKAKDVSSKAARIPRPKVPGPDPRAIPRVDMTKLMGAGDSLSPKDAFILSRIDGHTRVEQLNHLVPELSQEELTGLLVRSWKAGIVSFKR